MTRIRRRRVIAERDAEPSAYERDLWAQSRRNLRARLEATSMAEKIRLRQEAMDLGVELQRLWRERTGRL